MPGPGQLTRSQNSLELRSRSQPLHGSRLGRACARRASQETSDSQAFTAFGAARIDDSTATTGFHADQKAVGTGAADFRRLVSAFHDEVLFGLCQVSPPLWQISSILAMA